MVAKNAKTKQKSQKIAKPKAKAPALSAKAISDKQTKLQIFQTIAEQTELSTKQIKSVFQCANQLLQSHMMRRGSGEFSVPELGIKVTRKTKPARKARLGRNPATGETIKIAAKPKQEVIRIRALKALKAILD